MQLQAIYNQGRIEFEQPIRLKHDNIRLIVTVPDEEIELQSSNTSKAQDMIAKYQALLNAPLPPVECLPELSSNYETRLHAIELRNQIRKDQGRPV
jgi:hypothetical protein